MSETPTEISMRWGRPAHTYNGVYNNLESLAARVEQLIDERDHARSLACRLEEELAQYRCHVCAGTREHVLGCPEQDKPR